jgi:hypothetical protein
VILGIVTLIMSSSRVSSIMIKKFSFKVLRTSDKVLNGFGFN